MHPPPLQPALFDDADLHAARPAAGADARAQALAAVPPAPVPPAVRALADALHARWGGRLHLGTSSWHFPGWAGQTWDRAHPPARLSKQGLAAYAQHPLLRTVSLDRAFYRPLDAATCAGLAALVPGDFRFVVKAPALVTDAVQRDAASGAPLAPNPAFLDPALALQAALQPLAAGLGPRLGVLVFQLSPLPPAWRDDPPTLWRRLDALWPALRPALPAGAHLALELRDAALLGPDLAAQLKAHGVRHCLGLHDRLPPVHEQLSLLRALWPGPLVCRWNLQRGQRYAQARDAWAPFDRMRSPDPGTRATLARVLRATLDAGHEAFVTINNKAEGCAPASVLALAQALA